MLNFLIAFLFFVVIHSITAAQWFKDWVSARIGQRAYRGWYRLIYNGLSVITLLPVLITYFLLPSRTLWQIPSPYHYLFYFLQFLSLIGLTLSVMQSGGMAFVGLSQLLDYLNGEEREAQSGLGESLVVSGMFRYMRHPLYTFSMLLLWLNPSMTLNTFIFNLCASLYFVIGSYIEERRLILDFGDAYRSYKERVPRFIPRPWKS